MKSFPNLVPCSFINPPLLSSGAKSVILSTGARKKVYCVLLKEGNKECALQYEQLVAVTEMIEIYLGLTTAFKLVSLQNGKADLVCYVPFSALGAYEQS